LIERVFREEWGRVLASLVGFLGDFDLAEEAAQEAFATAAERWPREGYPNNPGAWLVTTARNRALDRLRRARTLTDKLRLLEAQTPAYVGNPADGADDGTVRIPDERLELLFMSCHPSLPLDAQVALTLRALGGLTTAEIARAFLVPYDTMKRRLSRAKASLKAANVRFELPDHDARAERLAGVAAVLYLIFNEGYGGRGELAEEAIRLGRLLATLLPDESEPRGLLALMLLHDARREARFAGGELVLLADQDRTRWNPDRISEGRAVLQSALSPSPGPYVLQAHIASAQLEPSIDWREVARLYHQLAAVTASPVVQLNHAVAVAHAYGPEPALRIVDRLDLHQYQYFHSTRAELLRRLGRHTEARAAFERALELTADEREQRFLRRRIAEIDQAPDPDHRRGQHP
jgi:RNA polymerase sigma-70 factor (ECF subfamily)